MLNWIRRWGARQDAMQQSSNLAWIGSWRIDQPAVNSGRLIGQLDRQSEKPNTRSSTVEPACKPRGQQLCCTLYDGAVADWAAEAPANRDLTSITTRNE